METQECPAQLVTNDSWNWFEVYQHYKSGFLPYSGGLLAQPAAFLDAMNIIESEFNSNE